MGPHNRLPRCAFGRRGGNPQGLRGCAAKPRAGPGFDADMSLRSAVARARAGGALLRAGIGAFALACAPPAARAQESCASAPAGARADHSVETGRVTFVNERLELTLADGRLLKIIGLDPPRPTPGDPDLDVNSSVKLADWLVGKDVAFRLLESRQDRWGRLAVEAFAPVGDPTSPAQPLAQAALAAGLARFEPGGGARQCRTSLLVAEASARAAALGLWADPYYAVIAAGDHDGFAGKAGTSVIVEGRVIGVERSAYRTMLLFGARRGWDFSVTILQRNTKIFGAGGVDLESLKGRSIRVRGLLDTRFGPQIEVSGPDEIEAMTQAKDDVGPERLRGVETGFRRAMKLFADMACLARALARQARRPAKVACALAAALAASLALAGCASIEPQGDTSFKMDAPPLPPRPPVAENKASAEHNRMVALFDGEYKDPAAEAYLNDILAKLAKAEDQSGDPYKVTILNSPIVNAFALPPRDLFITRGLLALANDASEVAAVMAHEIAHLTEKHAVRREEEEKRATVISQAATVIQNKQKGEEIQAIERRTIATFSRQQELDADQIGIKVTAKAGFDPYRRLPFPQRARTLRGDAHVADRSERERRQTRHTGDASLDARARRASDRDRPPDRGAGDRRHRPRALSRGHRRHDIRRQPDGGLRAGTQIPARAAWLRLRRPGRVYAGERDESASGRLGQWQ